MEMYSEYYGEGRKATVSKLSKGLDTQFNVWEVTMYVGNKLLQRRTVRSEDEAEGLAESFVQGGDGNQVLLNEVING
jgi:hypothetical protein